MNPTVATTYQVNLVVMSFAISVVGSFVGLTAATRIRSGTGQLSLGNLLAAGVALGGIGVWAMHFVGMLALKLDVSSGYAMTETSISLIAAVAATSLALGFVSKGSERQGPRIILAGFLLGMGIVFMHYLGMFGMRFGGFIRWNAGAIALSVLIAVIAATAALWLSFNTSSPARRAGAAVVMGVAVCAMHYTGMTAAEFICTTANRNATPQGFDVVSTLSLPALVVLAAFTMALLISLDQIFQRLGTNHGSTDSLKRQRQSH